MSSTAATTSTAEQYAALLASTVGVPSVSIDAHFYDDLGGDSLTLARFCAAVRTHDGLPNVSMRDVYGAMTARALARALTSASPATSQTVTPPEEPSPASGRASTAEYIMCGALQLVVFLTYVLVVSSMASLAYDWVTSASGLVGYYTRSVIAGAIAFVGISAAPIAAKWLLIGRWKETSIRVWSLGYLRFWTVRALVRTNPLILLSIGSPLHIWYLRALGARIGKGVVILSRNIPIATDLLTIGDDTVVRKDSIILGYRARAGRIEIGSVTLGRGVLISEATVLDIESSMGDRTQLGHQSSLHSGQHVPDDQRWAGSPARSVSTDFSLDAAAPQSSARRVRYSLAQLFSMLAVYLPLFIGGADVLLSMIPDSARLSGADLSPTSVAFYVEAAEIAAIWFFGTFVGGLLVVAVVPRLLAPAVRIGKVYPLYGFHYTAQRTIARLTSIKYYLYLFGDSSFILGYLRWVGYRLRRVAQTGSNFGTAVKHENPFATTVGSGTMVADGLSVMNAEFSSTAFRVRPVHIGPRNFLGNRIAYPSGGRTGENCLLATKVMVPIDGPIRTDVGLLGSPPFEIPRTVERDHRFDHVTRGVELHRRLVAKNRHNARSMALAVLTRWVYFFGLTLLTLFVSRAVDNYGPIAFLGQALTFLVFTTLWFIFLERAAAGFRRLTPAYCSIYHEDFWRHERYWKFVVPDWDRTLGGTPYKNLVSRMLGVRLGKRVFDDGCSITERTLVSIGDDVTLGAHTVLQCHSQEDGTFKSGRIHLGDRSTLGLGAFMHYGTSLGEDARISTDSFLMKGEEVPARSLWGANPAVHYSDIDNTASNRFWRDLSQREGSTSVPLWSSPSAPIGIATLTVPVPTSLVKAMASIATSTESSSRVVLAAVHGVVLAAVTRQSDVATSYRAAHGADPVPFHVHIGDATWRSVIGAARDLDRDIALHGVAGGVQNLRPSTKTNAGFAPAGTVGELDPDTIVLVAPSRGADALDIIYRTEALAPDAVERFAGYHLRALEICAEDLDAHPGDAVLLSTEEKTLQMSTFAGQDVPLPDKRIHQIIEDRVDERPDDVAVECGDSSWTYRRLDSVANRIAAGLLEHNVQPGDVIALATERTIGWMASVLGIFKVGAVYLPIEPHFPVDRITTTLNQAECALIMVEGDGSPTVSVAAEETSTPVVCIDPAVVETSVKVQKHWAGRRPRVTLATDGPAYIYFTSGSTGRPKGAMCEHAGMTNHILAKIRDLSIVDQSVVAQTAPQCFDISLWQLLAGVVVGGRTVIVAQDVILDVERFVKRIVTSEVAVLQVVPSYLDVILAYLETTPTTLDHLQCVSVTGEAVKKDLTERFFSGTHGITLVNAYGLTETSDDTNHEVMHSAPERDRVPLGPPIQNVRIYVVDDDLAPVPLGSHGEIVFSGVCVGRGYVNDPDRTAQAFLDDPHQPGQRLYRSGDLGRWLPEKKLEFLGRRDTQIKMRGFRIEIGEIDNALLGVTGIRDGAVVVAESADGGQHLCAFYIAPESVTEAEVKIQLARSLPDYMIPTTYTRCDVLPLTANSKIDRKALSTRAAASIGETLNSPWVEQTETDRNGVDPVVAQAWADVIGVDPARLRSTDNFFERGGTSLSAVKLAIVLGGGITPVVVKDNPMLGEMSSLVASNGSGAVR